MNKVIIQITVFGLITSALLPFAEAQEGQRGRLPDGRAYRTDANNIQLVDHVAELELTIESLNRRLEAAENEIRFKESQLANQSVSVLASLPALANSNAALEKLECPPQPQFLCPDQPLAVSQSLAIESQVSGADVDLGEFSGAHAHLAAVSQKLSAVEELNNKLQSQKAKDDQWFEQTLAARDSELSTLKTQLKDAQEKNVLLTQFANAGRSEHARAAYVPQRAVAALEPQTPVKVLDVAPDKNLAELKKSMIQEVAKTQQLLGERDKLFAQFSQSENSLQIRPSSAQTSRNRTLSQLRQDLEAEQSRQMLSLMSKEISDISRQISDDIELVKRVGKL